MNASIRIKWTRARAAGLAVLVCAAAIAIARPVAADPSEDPEVRLREQGWTIDTLTLTGADTPGVRHLTAVGRIAQPPSLVWKIIEAPDSEEGGWPSVKESIIESENGDTTISRFVVSIPVYKDRRYRLRSIIDRPRMCLYFEMVPGYGNVRAIDGRWEVAALGDSLAQLTYVLDTDPGVKLVPRFIVDWATRKAVPRLFEFVHERAALRSRPGAKMAKRNG